MLQLLSSPTRFFDNRQQEPPNWGLALAAPVACAGLQGVAALVLSAKLRPVMEGILANQASRPEPPPCC